jgi:hypothetical protein
MRWPAGISVASSNRIEHRPRGRLRPLFPLRPGSDKHCLSELRVYTIHCNCVSRFVIPRLIAGASLWKKGRAALWDTPNLELALKWKANLASVLNGKEDEKSLPKWAERYGKSRCFTIICYGAQKSRTRAIAGYRSHRCATRKAFLSLPTAISAATKSALRLLMVMSRDSRIAGQFRISAFYNVLGWLTVAFMTLASIGLLPSMVR